MWLEEWEWKIWGRIQAVLVVLLATLLVWHAGGTRQSGAAGNTARCLSLYAQCWERLCRF